MANFTIWKRRACPETGADVAFWRTAGTAREAWYHTWRQFRFMQARGLNPQITFAYRGPSEVQFGAWQPVRLPE